MRKLICAVLSVLLLLGAVVMAWAEDTATLTITPDKTEVTADGNDIQVVFTVTVAPPQGTGRVQLPAEAVRDDDAAQELQGGRGTGHHL